MLFIIVLCKYLIHVKNNIKVLKILDNKKTHKDIFIIIIIGKC